MCGVSLKDYENSMKMLQLSWNGQFSGYSFCLLTLNDTVSYSGNTFMNHPLFAFAVSGRLVNKYRPNVWCNQFHSSVCDILAFMKRVGDLTYGPQWSEK